MLAEAEGYLQEKGVRDRVTLSEGNMFERVDAQADVYVLRTSCTTGTTSAA